MIDAGYAQRLRSIIERAGLPVVGPPLGVARYLELMRLDKKAQAGQSRYVVIETPGRAGLRNADDSVVAQVLEAHTR